MAMNSDKLTVWIMFLSLSSLIAVFLVKTNPPISVHLQSAVFMAKKTTKRGCQGRHIFKVVNLLSVIHTKCSNLRHHGR